MFEQLSSPRLGGNAAGRIAVNVESKLLPSCNLYSELGNAGNVFRGHSLIINSCNDDGKGGTLLKLLFVKPSICKLDGNAGRYDNSGHPRYIEVHNTGKVSIC